MKIFVTAAKRWWQKDPSIHGAALSYYAIFSLAPMFIILVEFLGYFFNRQMVEGRLSEIIVEFFGKNGSEFVNALVAYTTQPVTGIITAVVSLAMIIVGSLALFSQVEISLDRMWHEEGEATNTTPYIRTKFLAVVMVVLLGVLLIASFIATSITTDIAHRINTFYPGLTMIIDTLNTILSIGYIVGLFTLMYKYLPTKPVSWKAAVYGGLTGGLLFLFGRYLLGLYIATQVLNSVYGAAGAVVLTLIWFYYSAQMFYFGGAVAYAVDQKAKMRQTSGIA